MGVRWGVNPEGTQSTVVVTDPVDFECPDCGHSAPAYYTAHASAGASDDGGFLTGRTIGPTEAEMEARERAYAIARGMQIQAVMLAPCPVCERLSEERTAWMRRELIKNGVFNGLMVSAVVFPIVSLALNWHWGLCAGLCVVGIATLAGVGDLQFLKRRGREVSFEAPEPEPEEDEVERWFEMLKNS